MTIILEAFFVFVLCGLFVISWCGYRKLERYIEIKRMIKHNCIVINTNRSNKYTIIDRWLGYYRGNSLDDNDADDFVMIYRQLNKDKDIVIIINTRGGYASSSMLIISCILTHKGNGKIVCIIPYCALSGGSKIALVTDQIVMHRSAVMSPCDVIVSINKDYAGQIMHVTSSLKKNIPILNSESHLHLLKCELILKEESRFLKHLVKSGRYNQIEANQLRDDFLSVKYTHEHVMTTDWLSKREYMKKLEVVDQLDDFVYAMIGE